MSLSLSKTFLAVQKELRYEAAKKETGTVIRLTPDKDVTCSFNELSLCVVRGDHACLISAAQLSGTSALCDCDIYMMTTPTEGAKVICKRFAKFRNNASFKDAAEINAYLRYWGKIPEFLEIRDVPGKGYGVFVKPGHTIAAGTFVGFYQGDYAQNMLFKNDSHNYALGVVGPDAKVVATIDAENITHSNWARFMNDGATANVEYVGYNYQTYCETTRDITENEELIVHYGAPYWNTRMNFLP